jgi:hypothetical protein
MDDMAKDDKGAGKGGGGVAVKGADRDVDTDVDNDGEDGWPLVAVDDMGVGDHDHECEWARVAVDPEAEDDAAEDIEHVLIVWGIVPITYSSKWGS